MAKMFPDQFRLDGKLALITGASRGIGTAIAQIYAEAGADIASVSRTENVELGKQIKAMGRRYQHFTADLSLREEVVKVVPAVAEAMGYPDILVNNAGSLRRGKGAINFKLVDWDWSLQLDLTTPYMLTMDCARHWIDNKKKGKIVNIATILAFSGGIDTIGYTAAKHGLAGLTKTLANDWSRLGINVNAVAPGYVRTDLTYGLWGDPKRKEMLLERVPSKKWGEPEDVAGCALYLAAPTSDWVHGAIYLVDGGYESW
jgi:2-deoxy-D-gluconate 3-dehydrogenase